MADTEPEAPKGKEKSKIEEKATSSTENFYFKDSFEILPSERLPDLDQGPVKAYGAKTKKGEPLFILLCAKDLVPRVEATSKYTGIQTSLMPLLKGSGVIKWPIDNKEYFCFIYENIYSKRVLTHGQTLAMDMREDTVRNVILPAYLDILEKMQSSDFAHGMISPHSLYLPKGVEAHKSGHIDRVVIAECLSLPFGYLQNPQLMTIERAIAGPLGAGLGSSADDLYALGATLACLLRKTDPLEGKSAKEVAAEKIEQGSYLALMGKNRVTGPLLELMRGLLQDDPSQRWTMEDIMVWREGQRIGLKQPSAKVPKAKRPIEFNNERFFRPDLLSLAMAGSPAKANILIENGELMQWVERSLGDTAFKVKIETVFETVREYVTGSNMSEQRLTMLLTVLSKGLPYFFRDITLLPEGLGRLMVYEYLRGSDMTRYADLIRTQSMIYWVDNTDYAGLDYGSMVTKIGNCASSLKQPSLGQGFERCFYILCEDAPCLSPVFAEYYVRNPEDIFAALDDLCRQGKAPKHMIDRHAAAFLSVRDRQMIDAYLGDLNMSDEVVRSLAVIKTLATLQYRAKMPPAPHLSTHIADTMGRILTRRFHDRELRDEMLARLNKVKATGSVIKIAELLDNEATIRGDRVAFAKAAYDYHELVKEHEKITGILERGERVGGGKGREIAALISAFAGGVSIVLTLLYHFSHL
ncbi:MAG: hypothetical protein AB7E85_05380 [Pseudobdellovibrionaceae bacterium]